MYETILVATDGSDESMAALEHAVELATSVDAAVYVVTVVDTGSNPMKFGVVEVDELNRAAADVVDDIVAAYDGSGVEITGDVRRGEPATVLLDYAGEVDADLVVAGQRTTEGVAGAILGSTTDRLARLTTVPLVVVPAE